jgi:hypothetical protein
MRIMFKGSTKHAAQLLADFERDSERVKGSMPIITELLAQHLPNVRFAEFSGDVKVWGGIAPSAAQADEYLHPTMEITAPDDLSRVLVQIKRDRPGTDLVRLMGLVVDGGDFVPEKRFYGLSQEEVVFKAQPDFRHNSLNFAERMPTWDSQKGTTVGIDVKQGFSGRASSVLEVRITELHPYDTGLDFGCALAKQFPMAQILYLTFGDTKMKSWQILHEGWDWNKGHPRLLAKGERGTFFLPEVPRVEETLSALTEQ